MHTKCLRYYLAHKGSKNFGFDDYSLCQRIIKFYRLKKIFFKLENP